MVLSLFICLLTKTEQPVGYPNADVWGKTIFANAVACCQSYAPTLAFLLDCVGNNLRLPVHFYTVKLWPVTAHPCVKCAVAVFLLHYRNYNVHAVIDKF